jgi:predicted DNA-binding transcriptional regulator AlpA
VHKSSISVGGDASSQLAGVATDHRRLSATLSTIAPALFTTEQAAAYLGMSEAKFHELRGEPWMCAPIPLGPRLVRWARTDLDEAIAAMPRVKAAPSEPAQLLRGRIERMKTGAAA